MSDPMRGPTPGAILLIILSFLIAIGSSVGYTTWQTDRLTTELKTSCGYYKVIATFALKPAPGTTQTAPSKTLVTWVDDALRSYNGQECQPHLPPSPSLMHWSAHYGIMP